MQDDTPADSKRPNDFRLTPKQVRGTRRRFLQNAAALGGLGFFGSCASSKRLQSTFGHLISSRRRIFDPAKQGKAFTPIANNEPVRIGVIGTGTMGMAHCLAFAELAKSELENVQVLAVSDLALPRMNDAVKALEEAQGLEVAQYQDYRKLIERDDLHGVVIATPEHWHADAAVEAVLAGKDVYVEKPLAFNLNQALWLKQTVDLNKQVVQVGTQFLMQPQYDRAKELIAQGAIGKPVWSQTSYCQNTQSVEAGDPSIDKRIQPGSTLDWESWCSPLGPKEWNPQVYFNWRRFHEFSTGIVGDLLVHVMTPLTWAIDAGWPVRIQGMGGHYLNKTTDNFDQVNMTIQFENDHTMVVAGSTSNDTGFETLVRGNKANIHLGSNHLTITPQQSHIDNVESLSEEFEGVDDQNQLRLDWLNSMRTRQATRSPVELALKIMVIVDLAQRSMWEGGTFDFDPESFRARSV